MSSDSRDIETSNDTTEHTIFTNDTIHSPFFPHYRTHNKTIPQNPLTS